MFAGFSIVKLNSNEQLVLGGYANREQRSQGILSDLEANIALIKAEKTIIWISLDSCAISQKVYNIVYEKLTEILSFDFELIVSASHTHSGYAVFYASDLEYQQELIQDLTLTEVDFVYLKEAITKIVDSIKEIQLQDLDLFYNHFETEKFASNRHDASLSYNNRVHLLNFKTEYEIKGLFIQLANHPTVLNAENELSSSDYVGELRNELRKNYPNLPCLFLQGDAALISTRFTRQANDLSEANRLIQPIKCSILEKLSNIKSRKINHVHIQPMNFTVHTKKFDHNQLGENPTQNDILGYQIAQKMMQMAIPERIILNSYLVSFDDIVFLTLPLELDDTITKMISQSLKTDLIVVGYTNNYLGYCVHGGDQCYEQLISLFDDDSIKQIINQLNEKGGLL